MRSHAARQIKGASIAAPVRAQRVQYEGDVRAQSEPLTRSARPRRCSSLHADMTGTLIHIHHSRAFTRISEKYAERSDFARGAQQLAARQAQPHLRRRPCRWRRRRASGRRCSRTSAPCPAVRAGHLLTIPHQVGRCPRSTQQRDVRAAGARGGARAARKGTRHADAPPPYARQDVGTPEDSRDNRNKLSVKRDEGNKMATHLGAAPNPPAP